MRKLIYVAVGCFMMANISFADVELKYGEGLGKVGFVNTINCPNTEELEAKGPTSFRVIDGKFYIADSVGNKIIVADGKGKVEKEFSMLPPGEFKPKPDYKGDPCLGMFVADICPIRGQYGDYNGMWVSDTMNNRVIKFNKEDKIQQTITNENFVQISKIEFGSDEHLFVSDEGANKIFIFDSNGKLVAKEEYSGMGFAVTGVNENLSRLCYSEEKEATFFVTSNLNNQLVREILVSLPGMFNPQLCWVDEENKCFVMSYATSDLISEDGILSKLKVAKISFNGKVLQTGTIDVASSMKRYLEHDNYEKIYIGKCDYDKAPNGKFTIVPFEFEK